MTLVSIPENPVPEGATVGLLKTPDGRSLRFARWYPVQRRQGTVCIFPGRAEFIEKYFEVVQEARQRGLAVSVLDWRGQGLSQRALSDPRKGHVESFREYDLDLECFVKEIMLPDCPPPFFALGHSMGASVLLRAAHAGRRWFDRMVLSTPMVSLLGVAERRGAPTAIRLARLAGLGRSYIPAAGATAVQLLPFAGNKLTSDPVRYARTAAVVEAEPKLGLGGPTIAWTAAALAVTRDFADPAYAANIYQPILMVGAGADDLVSTPAASRFALSLRAGSQLVIAGARHEILMEQDRFRQQFWAAFDAFVPGSPLFG